MPTVKGGGRKVHTYTFAGGKYVSEDGRCQRQMCLPAPEYAHTLLGRSAEGHYIY